MELFSEVNIDQFPNSMPLLDVKGKGKMSGVDELVCFQEAKTLPLFVIRLKDNGSYLFLFFAGSQSFHHFRLVSCSVVHPNG